MTGDGSLNEYFQESSPNFPTIIRLQFKLMLLLLILSLATFSLTFFSRFHDTKTRTYKNNLRQNSLHPEETEEISFFKSQLILRSILLPIFMLFISLDSLIICLLLNI